ncbi:hypothetical protein DFP72DRAFT_1165822 [Ephemerocybe angulata]|uniref:Nephrocystin 3-like N-terminal domain-containing protein n=1 Tax=Ephemerocybe angulata TaxID=980116 RepID=A0A8H6IBS8_9AGAR|nr:hypothetical protein DFP72DRAFT_1165822 [Tulosesus angulatus]
MDSHLQVARGRMDVDQGGPRFFSGASHVTGRDFSVRNAGRDMIIVNPAPISGPEASIEEVTAWLKGANFRAIYRVSLEARMDNTGTWFIATFEFGEFVRQKGTVVWATGLPGSGKTILTSISVEHLEDMFSGRTDVAILYAFLRYSEKPTLLQIIAGLLTQLVRCHGVALSHLLPTYLRAKRHRDDLSCSEAVKLLKESIGLFVDVFIVIDGLDEVDDTTKGGLLDILTGLHAHILLTCRPLELFMRHYTPRALHITVQAQTRDIEVYVAERIKQGPKLVLMLSEHPEIAENFTALIKEKSKGMFLLARLQMELVLEKCATIGSLLQALEALPSGINDMYRMTMDRINSRPEEEVSLAHRAFLWILYAKEDISPEDLQHALTFSYENKKFVEDDSVSIPVLLSICCGLVTVENRVDGKRVVRFIHYSTQEFLKGLAFSHLPDPHDLLAVTSVACVKTHLEMLTAALKSATQKSAGENWVSVSDVTQHLPLLHYALYNWGHHAKICDDQRSLNPFIHSFLSPQDAYLFPARSGNVLELVSAGLHLAAAYDLANLISSKTLPYSPTPRTKTPFHVAAEKGHSAALHALLNNYSGVHVSDETGRTPLHSCVSSESKWEPEVARQLLNLSTSDTWRARPSEIVDINVQDVQGCSAFFVACCSFAVFDIESLNDSTSPEGRILLLFTSHPGIDVNLPVSDGDTPFSNACISGGQGVAQFLISSIPSLKVDTRNKWGETPFMHACDTLSETLVEWFLSRAPGGCHFPHQEDNEGNTALERVVAYEGGAPKRNQGGHSRFNPGDYRFNLEDYNVRLATAARVVKIVRILSNHASHVRMVRAGHESLPIYQLRTSRPQQSPAVPVCLNDSHRRYEDERTSLMLLANYTGAVKYLVSENDDNPEFVNAQDSDGRCAIIAECLIEILTSCPSANIHLRDRDGMSALDYALYSKNIDILRVLLQHPSWNPLAIRSAVITAAQKRNIDPKALEDLLNEELVLDAFAEAGDDRTDGCALETALRRRGLEEHEWDVLWVEEEEDDELEEEDDDDLEEEEDDDLEEYPDRHKVLLDHPLWETCAIRNTVITAAQKQNIDPEALESLLNTDSVQEAFAEASDNREGGCALKTALRHRRDCEYILEDHTISGIFWDEEEEDHNREEYPDRRTPAAIRQATIATVSNPLTSVEQLESHFGQTEVKDAFVWDMDVRDPDTILLINTLARRSDSYDLFHNLFGGFKRCDGYRHEYCVHALIRF